MPQSQSGNFVIHVTLHLTPFPADVDAEQTLAPATRLVNSQPVLGTGRITPSQGRGFFT